VPRPVFRAGDIVTALGDVPVDKAVAAAMPRALSKPDAEANDYTLRVLLAARTTNRAISH